MSNFIRDLHKMVLDHYRKYLDGDQTRTEQGTWPTRTMVNMWFSNETNLPTMVGLLDIMKEELKKEPYRLRGQVISSRLEISPKKRSLVRARALFYKGLKEVGGNTLPPETYAVVF